MHEIVIVKALRTPIGTYKGSLKNLSADKLGTEVIKNLIDQSDISVEEIDEVIMGQVLTAGQGQNPARQASVNAGMPISKPAHIINQVCGSGLRAIISGYQSIMLNDSKVVIAGGQENMSKAPHSIFYREEKKFNENQLTYLKENFSLDEITSKLLSIRNIKNEEVIGFLNPSIKNFLPNPENLIDMKRSSLRTVEAIKNHEKIGIFGDYDVDGASATALLANFFNSINIPYEIYIPDRKKEGYGPSAESFKKLIDNGTKLIFTVDCGTLSFDAIDYASNNDIDVIVLDHHQSEINLPKAHSIINPNRLDDKSDLKYLCAAGVTFYVFNFLK